MEETKEKPIYYNNIVWKFKAANKYPKQVYRDSNNAVFRTQDCVYGFLGYDILEGKAKLDVENSMVSNKLNDTTVDVSIDGKSGTLEGDYGFKFDGYNDKILELEIYIFELDEDGTKFKKDNLKWDKDPYLDDAINNFARAVIDELDIQMLRKRCANEKELIESSTVAPVVETSTLDKIKSFFTSTSATKPVELEEVYDPYKYLRDIPLSEIITQKVHNYIYTEMKEEDPNIRDIIEPLIMVIRII